MTLAAFFGNHELNHLLSSYGYAAVFLIVGAESVGIPLPGETTLTLAAIYAGSTHRLNIVGVIAAAAAGAIIGDNVGYLIGRYLFDRHGGKVVFFGRFVSILRTYAAFLAGTMKMPWRRFLVFNAGGGIVWATIVGVGFYYFASALKALRAPFDIAIGIAAILALVGGLVVLRRKEKQLGTAAERAYPGPLD